MKEEYSNQDTYNTKAKINLNSEPRRISMLPLKNNTLANSASTMVFSNNHNSIKPLNTLLSTQNVIQSSSNGNLIRKNVESMRNTDLNNVSTGNNDYMRSIMNRYVV